MSVERHIVGAVLLRDGRALVLRRNADDFMGGTWELPSGRVEPRESLEDALRREVEEEAGLRVTAVVRRLSEFEYRSKSGKLTRQVNFVVECSDDPVALSEHDAHEWVGTGDLDRVELTPETRRVVLEAFADAY
jgi:8-oxo-dGTP diphosphatase